MKWFAAGIMLVMMGFGFMNAGGGGSAFDWESASREERAAWMEEQAAVIKKRSRFFMQNGYGPSAINFHLDEVNPRPERREMEAIVRAVIPRNVAIGVMAESKVLPKACKDYKGTPLYKAGVKLTTSVRNKERGQLMRVSVTPEKCDAVLAAG